MYRTCFLHQIVSSLILYWCLWSHTIHLFIKRCFTKKNSAIFLVFSVKYSKFCSWKPGTFNFRHIFMTWNHSTTTKNVLAVLQLTVLLLPSNCGWSQIQAIDQVDKSKKSCSHSKVKTFFSCRTKVIPAFQKRYKLFFYQNFFPPFLDWCLWSHIIHLFIKRCLTKRILPFFLFSVVKYSKFCSSKFCSVRPRHIEFCSLFHELKSFDVFKQWSYFLDAILVGLKFKLLTRKNKGKKTIAHFLRLSQVKTQNYYYYYFFFFTQVQTPVTLCSGELWSILVVRLAHSADLRSRLRHVYEINWSHSLISQCTVLLFFVSDPNVLFFFLTDVLCLTSFTPASLHDKMFYKQVVLFILFSVVKYSKWCAVGLWDVEYCSLFEEWKICLGQKSVILRVAGLKFQLLTRQNKGKKKNLKTFTRNNFKIVCQNKVVISSQNCTKLFFSDQAVFSPFLF